MCYHFYKGMVDFMDVALEFMFDVYIKCPDDCVNVVYEREKIELKKVKSP